MSDLSSADRLKIEALFGMESGYVIDFSNNKFSMFTVENIGIDIFDSKYEYGSSSKANRLRKFWLEESNEVVGKLLSALLDYWLAKKQINGNELSSKEETLYDECRKIASRLNQVSFNKIHEYTSFPSQKGSIFSNGMGTTAIKRTLKVFLCHSSQDKPAVQELYNRLLNEKWIDPWLDKEKLLPGQDFDSEIEKAIESSDAVIAFISKIAVSKTGYIQKELKLIYNAAMFKPEGQIFSIPLRLEECTPPPSLKLWHWSDYFGAEKEKTYKSLLKSLEIIYGYITEEEQESELEKLESQAIRYELLGDLWNARKTWYEIKRIDPLFPRVDIKIRELEHEIYVRVDRDKAAQEKAVHEAAEKATRENADRQAARRDAIENLLSKLMPFLKFIVIVGFVSILVLLVSWAVPKFNSLIPTTIPVTNTTVTLTRNPTPTKTVTPTFTKTKVPTSTSTVTPTADPFEFTDSLGVPMRLVPSGNFVMGSSNIDDLLSECLKIDSTCKISDFGDEEPSRIIYLDAFYIDKYEVTNERYKACVDLGICEPPVNFSSSSRDKYYENPQYDTYPVVYVNWDMANTYCLWRETRLPTEAEWEKASRGVDGNKYPWGEDIDCSYANYLGCEGDTTSVTKYSDKSASPFGLYDMAGNVWEWIADYYDPAIYYSYRDNMSNPQGSQNPLEGNRRVIRGGSWGNYSIALRTANRLWDYQVGSWNYVGFRCARDVNP